MQKSEKIILTIFAVLLPLAIAFAFLYSHVTSVKFLGRITPDIDSVYIKIDSANFEVAEAEIYFTLTNVLPVDVRLDSVKARVSISDTIYGGGNQREGFLIRKGETKRIHLSVKISHRDLTAKMQRSQGELLRINITGYFDIPYVGKTSIWFGSRDEISLRRTPALKIHTVDVEVSGDELRIAKMNFHLEIDRDLPSGSVIDSLDYIIYIDGRPLIKGERIRDVFLDVDEDDEILLPAVVQFTEITDEFRRRIDEDSIWVRISGAADLTFEGQDKFKLVFDIDNKIFAPVIPDITLEDWHITYFSFDTTTIEIELKVVNKNQMGLTISSLNYEFFLRGKKLATHYKDIHIRIEKDTIQNIRIPANVIPGRSGWTALNMLLFDLPPDYLFTGSFDLTYDLEALGNIILNLQIEGRAQIGNMGDEMDISFREFLMRLPVEKEE